EIGAGDVPELLVYNKVDVTHFEPRFGAVGISALTGQGIDELLLTIADRLRAIESVIELLVPYDRGDVLAALHREGEVLVEAHEEDATRLRARLDKVATGKFAPFRVER